MKDRKLNPFRMDDKELEVFVRSILSGRKFNFDARNELDMSYNQNILRLFEEYFSKTAIGSCAIESYKGGIWVNIFSVKSSNKKGWDIKTDNYIQIDFTSEGTVGIIMKLIRSESLLSKMQIKV